MTGRVRMRRGVEIDRRVRLFQQESLGAVRRDGVGVKGQRWPMRVACYGRTYEVHDAEAFTELLSWLDQPRLALANRYRVGKSWPRGTRTRDWRLWACRDCGGRHRGWNDRCLVSQRPRAEAEKTSAAS